MPRQDQWDTHSFPFKPPSEFLRRSGWGARDGRERPGSTRWTRAVGEHAMDASGWGVVP